MLRAALTLWVAAIALKLVHAVDWSWWAVCAPILAVIGMIVALVIGLTIYVCVEALIQAFKKKT